MDLHELAPVGGRATSGRHWWRLERFAEVCQYLTSRGRSHPGLRPLSNLRFDVNRLLPAVCSEPDVTASRWARKRKLLTHPGHQFRPGNSRGVVRAGLCMSVTAVFHGMSADSPADGLPAGHGVAPLANMRELRFFRMGERKPRVEEPTSVKAAAAGSLLLQAIFRRGIV